VSLCFGVAETRRGRIVHVAPAVVRPIRYSWLAALQTRVTAVFPRPPTRQQRKPTGLGLRAGQSVVAFSLSRKQAKGISSRQLVLEQSWA